jgi:hypothetical protein
MRRAQQPLAAGPARPAARDGPRPAAGGALLLSLPAYQGLLSPHDEAYGQDRRFTRRELAGLLRATGFEVAAATYWNSLLLPATASARLWRRRFPGRPGSDLAVTPQTVAGRQIPRALLGLERALLRLTPLPFGLSVFVVGRRR